MRGLEITLSDSKTRSILEAALDGIPPSREDLEYLARMRNIETTLAMFKVARRICELNFGKKVFLYGFVYFSTYCRNVCTFCRYNRTNLNTQRYRKSLEEVLEAVEILEKSGVHLVDLTMGEDPKIRAEHYKPLIEMCREIKYNFNLPIMVSPGVVPREVLSQFKKIGVEWYALYQETYNRSLFSKLRPRQSFDERLYAKILARRDGLLIEDGILMGVGETDKDIIDSIISMKEIGAEQVRIMSFQPASEIPLKAAPISLLDELRAIAMMRFVHQDKLIPASYDIDGIKGLELRLMAGANVITSLLPPGTGFVGVAQPELGINDRTRTVEGIRPYVERLGLEVATRKQYVRYIEKRLLEQRE